MADIYEQHRAAFARVAAYVVLHRGERVATVAFKYPADGAGRLYAYVHWFHTGMVRGSANGGGYDKASAAVSSAVEQLTGKKVDGELSNPLFLQFRETASIDDGAHWDDRLRSVGFQVLQAV
jgi:hypothetical protein